MSSKTLRGGSWNNNPRNVRASNRNRNEPGKRNNNNGFRCLGDGRHRECDEGQSRFAPKANPGVPSCDPEDTPGRESPRAEHQTGLALW
jgi:hypothetical protein